MLASSPFSAAWPKRQLGDLLTRIVKPLKIKSDAEYREIGIRSHCKGIFHKSPVTGKQLGSKRVFWVEPGCLVLNIVFAWEQAVAVTSENERGMIASHRFPMYQSIDGQLLPEYAFLYFSSPQGKYDLGLASPGGAGRNKTLGQEEFRRLKIPVPPPEYQQFTIKVIHTWDRAIVQTEKLIEAKRKLKQGLMQQLLAGKRRLLKTTDTWSRINLGSAIRCYSGGTPSRSNGSLFEGAIPWIKSGELNSKNIYSTEESISEEAVNESAVKYVSPDTLLYALYGATAGIPAFSRIRATINQAILAIIPNGFLSSEYLYYWLLHSREYLLQKYTQGGQPNLSAQLVKGFEVPVPPLAEQNCIVSVLNTIDQEIEILCRLSGRLKE